MCRWPQTGGRTQPLLLPLLLLSWLPQGWGGTFSLTAGTSCSITDGGACVQSESYPSNYLGDDSSSSKHCTISAGAGNTQALQVVSFDTEGAFDFLSIEGFDFSGPAAPTHVAPPDGLVPASDIVWSLDQNTQRSGWRLCLEDADPGTWTQITTTRPDKRGRGSMVATGSVALLYGGRYWAGSAYVYKKDLWQFENNVWTNLVFSGGSPAMSMDHTAAYDPVNDAMLIWGGVDPTETRVNSLYRYLIQTNTMELLGPSGTPPSPKEGSSGVFSNVTKCFLVLGGYTGTAFEQSFHCYDVEANSWSSLVWLSSMAGRAFHKAAVNSDESVMLVYGGNGESSAVLSDLWRYDVAAGSWILLLPTTLGPGARTFAVAGFYHDCFLIFGGQQDGGAKPDDRMWCYSLQANKWMVDWSPGGTFPGGGTTRTVLAMSALGTVGGAPTLFFFGGYLGLSGSGGDYTDTSYSYQLPTRFQPTTTTTTATATFTTTLQVPNTWAEYVTLGPKPSARWGHAAVWIESTKSMIVFGGTNTDTPSSGNAQDFWQYSVQGNYWAELQVTGTLPSVRRYHTAVMASSNNCMLIFAGTDGASTYNDLYCYNVQTGTSALAGAGGATPPAQRYLHSAVMHDASNCMFVYGGISDGSTGRFTDLHCYDVVAADWIVKAVAPTQNAYHPAAVYADMMLVYGGTQSAGGVWTAGSETDRTWQYNISADSWSEITGSLTGNPPARVFHTAVWLESDGCMLVSGAFPFTGATQTYCLYPGASTWSQNDPGGVAVPELAAHSAVLDTENNCVLIFGGFVTGMVAQDGLFCYTLTGRVTSTTMTTSTMTFTTTQQGQNIWAELVTIGTAPAGRSMYSQVFQESSGLLVIFGGSAWSPSGENRFADLWMYSIEGNFWIQKTNLTTPTGSGNRYGHSAVLSTADSCMLVFGGFDVSNVYLNDLWCYDMTADVWSDKSAANPPVGRVVHTAVMASNNCMYVYGGYENKTNAGGFLGAAGNDLHCYNVQTNAWTEVTPTGDVPLLERYFHVALMIGDCMYVHGGTNDTGSLADVGCFNIVTGTYTTLNTAGPPRNGHAVAHAPTADCMLTWGGFGSSFGYGYGSSPENFPYCYNYLENQWEKRAEDATHVPSLRAYSHGAYIPQWDSQLFWGGQSLAGAGYLNDMWVFRAGTTTTSTTTTATVSSTGTATFTATEQADRSWAQLVSVNEPPPARAEHAAALSSNDGGLLLACGGAGHNGSSTIYFNDLWVYSLQGSFWIQKASLPAMGRVGHTAVASTVDNCVLVFGGAVQTGSGADYAYFNDFWCYNVAIDSWSSLSDPNLPSARAWHAAVMAPDGNMYVTGGTSSTLSVFEFHRYDASAASHGYQGTAWSGAFFPSGSFPSKRFRHSAVLIGDCIYIHGGQSDQTTWNQLGCYNIQTNVFSWLTFYEPRAAHAGVWEPDAECVLYFGGWTDAATATYSAADAPLCYLYAEDQFELAPVDGSASPSQRYGLTAVRNDTSVLFFGGFNEVEGYLNDMWSYRASVRTTSTSTSTTLTNTTTSSTISSTSSTATSSFTQSTTVTSSFSTSSSTTSSSTTFSSTTSSSKTSSLTTSSSFTRTTTSITTSTTSRTETSSTSTSRSSTTTRTKSTNVTASFMALEASQAAALDDVLRLAANSSEVVTQITFQEPDGTQLLAAAIRTEDAGSDVVLALETASVAIPAGDLGAASASLASLGEGSDLFDLLNNSLNGTSLVLSSPPLSINLFDEDGKPITGDLPAPLKFNLTAGNASSEPGAACKFWDEEMEEWSSRGVATLAASDGSVQCSTMHLSLFAIILDTILSTFACSNAASIFSLEGLRSLRDLEWVLRLPAVLNWVMLVMGGTLLGQAVRADRRARRALDNLKRTVDACAVCRQRKQPPHTLWGDIKNTCAELLHLDLTRSISSVVVRRRTGVSLDALDKMYHEGGTTVTHDVAKNTLANFREMSCLAKLFILYEVNCAFMNVRDPRMSSTSLQRTAVVVARLYSGWAVSAIFFGSTSLAPGQPECEPKEGLLEKVVRSVVVSWVAAVVGALPLASLIALVGMKSIPRIVRLAFFWMFLCAYFLLCLMVVCIFIASVSPSDSEKWFISALTTVLQGVILTPLLIALLMFFWLGFRVKEPLDTSAARHWTTTAQLQEVRLDCIAIPDAAIKQLLQTEQKEKVQVTVQVAGRNQISTLEEVNGTYRSRKVYNLEPNQVLIISVYQLKRYASSRAGSHFGLDRVGSVSSQTWQQGFEGELEDIGRGKLLATAFLEVDKIQDGGFAGALPLYHKKKDLHVTLDAKTVPPPSKARPPDDEDSSDDSSDEEGNNEGLAGELSDARPKEEAVLEVRPESSSESEAEVDIPKELQKPIIMMSLENISVEGGNMPESDEERDHQVEPTQEASRQQPMHQMGQGEMQMEPPPSMEASDQQQGMGFVHMELPPPVEAPESPQATLTLPPAAKAVARAPRSPLSQASPPSGRSRRQELAEAAEPKLADLIKAAENRFNSRSASPSPASRNANAT